MNVIKRAEYNPPSTPYDSVREFAFRIWNDGDPFMAGGHEGLDSLERLHSELEELRKDKARLDWFFGPNVKTDFLPTYFEGVNSLWDSNKWRAAIDVAMEGK